MALSVPPPPMHTSWNRTLPNPAALMPNGVEARRSSSLLQHHISSDQFMTPASDANGRTNPVPYIPSLKENENENEKGGQRNLHGNQGFVRQRQGSAMSEDSMTDVSSEGASPRENPTGYCLCVPEPKIPRPRNAFILYRQHQHAGVVAQHPGLPNPDISKIIGEQWRHLSVKEKNEWKALAEQEKARHSQQFPDYRYRPKRNGKYQSTDGSQALTNHPQNCSKCGGKTMNPPHTPQYPTYEHSAGTPIVSMPRPPKRPYAEAHGPPPPRQPSMVQVGPPPYAAPVHYGYNTIHQPRRESVHYVTQPPPPPPPPQRLILEDSEAKRRRLNASYPMRPAYDQRYNDRERPAYHRESIARPMPPPPHHRPSHQGPQNLPPRGSQPIQRKDLSLTLPPLKTGAQPVPVVSPKALTLKSNVESTIMSYSLLTKLKTLSSITPLLASSDQASSPYEMRGVIIAIEGLERRRVEDMTATLAEQLEKEGKFYVRTFRGPTQHEEATSSQRTSHELRPEKMSHAKYLDLMSKWHKLNQQVVEFVTHRPGKVTENDYGDHEMTDGPVPSPTIMTSKSEQNMKGQSQDPYERSGTRRSPISAISPGTVDRTSEMVLDTPVTRTATQRQNNETAQSVPARVTRSRLPQLTFDSHSHREPEPESESPPPPPPASARLRTPSPPPSPATTDSKISNLIPVALIPQYQLTTVDTCSMALPITDNYDALTHWRWHATLWRGCTGPDISIVIQNNNDEDLETSSADGKMNTTPGLSTDNQVHGNGNTNVPPPPSTSVPTHPHPQAQSQTPNQTKPQQQSTTTSSQPQQSHTGTPFNVDVRLQDYRAVIVRTRSSTHRNPSNADLPDEKQEKENENWEKAKRRVGFEVEEWVRR